MIILLISSTLFFTGLLVIARNRQNIIRIFIGAELSLLGASWNLLFCVKILHLLDAYIFILVILAVAAIEIAIGLGLIVLVSSRFETIKLAHINTLGKR
jgi:NADH-quinone oxidoreductase subunit K